MLEEAVQPAFIAEEDRLRGARRLACAVAVEVRAPFTSRPVVFESRDISSSGLFVYSQLCFDLGARLHCTFTLPSGHRISTQVRVSRVVFHEAAPHQSGMGLEFIGLSSEDQSLLRDLRSLVAAERELAIAS